MQYPLINMVALPFDNLSLMVKSHCGIKFDFNKEKGGNYEYDTRINHFEKRDP